MTFRESIRKILVECYTQLTELYAMKNFNTAQVHVLQQVMRQLGVSTEDVSKFLTTPKGQMTMKAFRALLISKFGAESTGMPHTDEVTHLGFNVANQEAHQQLVKELSQELLATIKGTA